MSIFTRDIRAFFTRNKNIDLASDLKPSNSNDSLTLESKLGKSKARPTGVGARRKVRTGCRPAQYLWERVRIDFLLLIIFGMLFVADLQSNPLINANDAFLSTAQRAPEIAIFLFLETFRQILIFIAERSSKFYKFILFLAKLAGYPTRRVSERGKANLSRALFYLFLLSIYAIVASKFTGTGPIGAIFGLPTMIIKAAPMLAQLAFGFFFVIFQFIGLFWFLSKGGIDTYFPEDIKTRFSQVWGQDHVVSKLRENLVLLEDPESIEARGGHVPSGILMWGPPGTGKTLMAEAIAGETGKPYVFVDPGAFTNMFMGVGILKVKSLFRRLRKLSLRYGGVIVFFDEADSLGSRGGVVSRNAKTDLHNSVNQIMSCNSTPYLSPSSREVVGIAQEKVIMGGMGAGGAGSGTLQALLTELQGLKKPRGFFNRVVRRGLGMRPKEPPKYRILVMMATNMPDSLDPALLRPGRIDRIYRVGYPSKEGRTRTYQGYFAKVNHNLTDADLDRLSTATPYSTGAKIKDMVNEALISALSRGSDIITWEDVIKAKHLKELGPSEGVIYNEREQHSVAIHEACHAVTAYRLRKHLSIDVATIEKGSDYLGMVSSIPFEELFSSWSSYYESDISVALASLVGERLFFDGDSTSGVSGDLDTATRIAAFMESRWGMGETISSTAALIDLQAGQPIAKGVTKDDPRLLGERVESRLSTIYEKTSNLLQTNINEILSVAHALEVNKTLTGPDVEAVINAVQGPLLDGRIYSDANFIEKLNIYHKEVLKAHQEHRPVELSLPSYPFMHENAPELQETKLESVSYEVWPGSPDGEPGKE